MGLKSERIAIRRKAVGGWVLLIVGVAQLGLSALQFLNGSIWLGVLQIVVGIILLGYGATLIVQGRKSLNKLESEHGLDAGKQ